MRRWLAIPVAAIIAVAVGAVSWQGGSQPAEAGGSTVAFSIDCDASTGGIQNACVFTTGTSTVTAAVVLTNQSGASFVIDALGFTVIASGATTFQAATPACAGAGTDCNPDFNQAGITGSFACSSPLPVADTNASTSIVRSTLGCFNGTGNGPTLANGASIVVGTVTYSSTGDGVIDLAFGPTALADDTSVYDDGFNEQGSCPLISVAALCTDANVQIGASAATATPVNTATPTNTAVPTNTPCVTGCATPTSLAYKTVTPTGTITVAGDTPIPGVATTAPPPPAPPAGGAPGGTTAGGGRGGIRLPDTGTGTGTSANDTLILFALMAIAVAAIAGGSLWHSMAAAASRRED